MRTESPMVSLVADKRVLWASGGDGNLRYVRMYVKIRRHQHTRVHAKKGRGATPELRRVADTTYHMQG